MRDRFQPQQASEASQKLEAQLGASKCFSSTDLLEVFRSFCTPCFLFLGTKEYLGDEQHFPCCCFEHHGAEELPIHPNSLSDFRTQKHLPSATSALVSCVQ